MGLKYEKKNLINRDAYFIIHTKLYDSCHQNDNSNWHMDNSVN